MNLDFLESFGVFARTLNFTHAAKERHLSQPALHKQIRSLSESLGVALYQKVGRNLLLTPAGHRLARLERELGERIGAFEADVLARERSARVGLAAGRGAYLYLLGKAISGFVKSGAEVDLRVEDQKNTLESLESGRAHLGVTVLPEVPDGYRGELIREVSSHLIVREDHELADRKWIDLRRLGGLPLIIPPHPRPMRVALATVFEQQGLKLSVSLEASGWELMMHFASLGLGAAVVNGCCRPPRGTRAVPIRGLPKNRYYLLHSEDLYFSPPVRDLYGRIVKSAQAARLMGPRQ